MAHLRNGAASFPSPSPPGRLLGLERCVSGEGVRTLFRLPVMGDGTLGGSFPWGWAGAVGLPPQTTSLFNREIMETESPYVSVDAPFQGKKVLSSLSIFC